MPVVFPQEVLPVFIFMGNKELPTVTISLSEFKRMEEKIAAAEENDKNGGVLKIYKWEGMYNCTETWKCLTQDKAISEQAIRITQLIQENSALRGKIRRLNERGLIPRMLNIQPTTEL